MKNQFGLPRDIPAHIKREVRQRCGYGCVICGTAVIEYEHVRPEFSKARSHDAAGIALLCPTCHAKKTRNFLSSRRVLECMADPAAKKAGFAFSDLESATTHPYVILGGNTLTNCPIPIEIRGMPVIQFEDAEAPRGPFLMSASFFDKHERPSLLIRRNEWQVSSEAWDVEAIGGAVTVRSAPGEIALQLLFDPGQGVIVERIRMYCAGYLVEGNQKELEIISPSGGRHTLTGSLIDNCGIGFSLN